jgi:hypothetical protein
VIRIEQSNTPIVWQINTSYRLPSITGQVRWNGNTREFEVADPHNGWHRIDPTVQLESPNNIAEVIEWARKKMEFEKKVEKLANEYPAVKDAKEKLDIILKLVQDEKI